MSEPTKNVPDRWERAVRNKLAFICMAAAVGKNGRLEGDLQYLANDFVRWLRATPPPAPSLETEG